MAYNVSCAYAIVTAVGVSPKWGLEIWNAQSALANMNGMYKCMKCIKPVNLPNIYLIVAINFSYVERPGATFTYMVGWNFLSISQTLTVAPLKFGYE